MQSQVFSFFSGAGFLDLGFEDAGFSIAFVNENCKPFLDAYKYSREKLGHKSPVFGYSEDSIEAFIDGRNCCSKELKQHFLQTRAAGKLVGFIGGPPCPDFSNAGKHQGFSGENGKLTSVYFDLIKKHQPDWFLYENVKGLLHTKKHRDFIDAIFQEIRKDYAIDQEMLNSLEFGVPQYRERIIVFGIKRDLCFHDLAAPSLSADASFSELKSFCPRKHKTHDLEQVLKAPWPERHSFKNGGKRNTPEEIPMALTVQHWFERNAVDTHPNAKHHFLPTEGNERFDAVEEGYVGNKSYKRLHRWRYSPTAAYGNNEVHLHPYKPRRLSAAEALAIQSMPKEFQLPVGMPLSYMFKTIGNGVPFLMARAIAQSIQEYLALLESTEIPKRRAASHSW